MLKYADEFTAIANLAKEYDRTKVVIIGGDELGSYQFIHDVKTSMKRSRNISLVWIDWLSCPNKMGGTVISGLELVNRHLMESTGTRYSLRFGSWADALHMEIALPHLVAQAKRINEMEARIAAEEKLIAQFPTFRRVCTIVRVKRDDFEEDTTIDANCVVVFNNTRTKCVVQGSRRTMYCNVLSSRGETFLRGLEYGFKEESPLRIIEEVGDSRFKLTTKGASYLRTPHPPVDPADPDFKFVPLWQRIQ